ncbi:hypothetical protein DMUE_1994 [Dictyocoela muelleri]|nr:hypothetical protein DMUE_1994 [Dictyocoela muelleri]
MTCRDSIKEASDIETSWRYLGHGQDTAKLGQHSEKRKLGQLIKIQILLPLKNFQLIKNQKGNGNLESNGYIYNKDNISNRKDGWRCTNRKCRATGIINDQFVFEASMEQHNHSKDYIMIEKCKALNIIKERAEKTQATNMKIVTDVTSMLDEEVLTKLPKFKNLLDKCTKLKKKSLVCWKQISKIFLKFFYKDLRNDKFLQYDKGVHSIKRFFVFLSSKNFNLLKSVSTVLIDGTFWSVPSNFCQLITINCYLFGKFFPLCYIL